MRTITAALLGAGQRGMGAYAPYALDNPDDLRFVAVAETDPELRERFRLDHRLPITNCFSSWEELLAGPKLADAILICTQDNMHYGPALKALEKGYHVRLSFMTDQFHIKGIPTFIS